MVVATALGSGNAPSIALSILLAFVFGYSLTIRPVLAAGVGVRGAAAIAVASDTVSIPASLGRVNLPRAFRVDVLSFSLSLLHDSRPGPVHAARGR